VIKSIRHKYERPSQPMIATAMLSFANIDWEGLAITHIFIFILLWQFAFFISFVFQYHTDYT